jgi:hypothetical protein
MESCFREKGAQNGKNGVPLLAKQEYAANEGIAPYS